MNNLINLFARGFSGKEALDLLIEKPNETIYKALALNRNLTSTQVADLLTKTDQVSRRKATPYRSAAILVASRLDLNEDHLWSILRSKNSMLRDALLSLAPGVTLEMNHPRLSKEMIDFALTQPWFAHEHCTVLYMKREVLGLTPEALELLEQRYLQLLPATPLKVAVATSFPWGGAFRYNQDRIEDIRLHSHYGQYLAPVKRTESYPGELFDLLDRQIGELNSGFDLSTEYFALWVEKALATESRQVYSIFFELLPTWEGSLAELIHTAQTLQLTSVS